ncbi:MAG: hypothetical protein MUD12_08740 [Spirochaetes bacterium]|nr:hypothetical protein [Spirochaetota bacterium]
MKKKSRSSGSLFSYIGELDSDSSFGLLHNKKENLFLGKFDPAGIMEIMEKVGFVSHLNNKGFPDIKLTIEVDESLINYLKVYYSDVKPDNLLLDLRLSESKFVPDKKFFEEYNDVITFDMVVIEWLSTQDPKGNFTHERPQLPGQKSPGLGALKYCFDMMYAVGKDVIKDGFLDIPDHGHGAVMYSKKFKFFDPAHEGVLRAILRDLKKYPLSDISWGMITNTIIDVYKDKPHIYDPSEQIFYISNRMRKYFHSKKYQTVFKKYYKIKKFRFDYDRMVEKRAELLKSKNILEL